MITRRNLLFLLSSVGLTAGAPKIVKAASEQDKSAQQDKSARTTSSLAASNDSYLRLEDFGGVADGVTNNSPALNAALNALKSTNGGTIVFPNGVTKLCGTAQVDMLANKGAISLVGAGGNSVVHVATGTGIGIGVYNTTKLDVENLTFKGTFGETYNGDFYDCSQSVINCGHVEQVTISNCKFLGIAINAPYGEAWNGFASNKEHGIISVSAGDLLVDRCYFGGCATYQCANVSVNAWHGLTIRDSRFIDFGYYNNQSLSKTPVTTNTAWVRAINPEPVVGALTRGKIKIERTSFDEGCIYGLFAYGAQWVEIDNLAMNNGIGPGILLVNVAHTRIKDSFIGNVFNTGLYALNSKIIELDSLILGGGVKYIQLDSGVSKLISKHSTLPGGALYPNGIINNAKAALEIIK